MISATSLVRRMPHHWPWKCHIFGYTDDHKRVAHQWPQSTATSLAMNECHNIDHKQVSHYWTWDCATTTVMSHEREPHHWARASATLLDMRLWHSNGHEPWARTTSLATSECHITGHETMPQQWPRATSKNHITGHEQVPHYWTWGCGWRNLMTVVTPLYHLVVHAILAFQKYTCFPKGFITPGMASIICIPVQNAIRDHLNSILLSLWQLQ